MMSGTLRDSITDYIGHLEDTPWVESLITRHGIDAVLRECMGVLVDRNSDDVHEVTTLLRDVAAGVVLDEQRVKEVRALMPTTVLPALRPLLRVPVLQLRMTAIYTIGKISFAAEAEALRDV